MHQFLFNSHHPRLRDLAFYGPPCTQRVVKAIESLDPMPVTRLLWGNALPEHICYKLEKFKVGGPMTAKKPGGVISRADEYHRKPDNDLFKLVVCDLAESLSAPPSTVAEDVLLLCLARGSLWAVGASDLTDEQALIVDRQLRDFLPYIGMTKIDLGNPLQKDVMVESMFHKDIVLAPHGIIYLAETYRPKEDQDEALYLVKQKGSSKPPIGLEWEEFESALPPIIFPETLSERGLVTASRIAGKATVGHRDRIAKALLNRFENTDSDEPIEFSTTRAEGVEEFEFDPRKFTDYLLNINHPKGGSKANFFISTLGIAPDDWPFLADQIKRGMVEAPIYRVGKNEWGFSHGALVLVTGRNGNSAVIETGWMIGTGKPAKFVTAYPYDGASEAEFKPVDPYVVDSSLKGDARWEAIFARAKTAGKEASNAVVPTPMVLEDYGTEWEGMCGFGWVHLPNARHPMAKWLLKSDLGNRAHPGVTVWSTANTQSLDRNRAWAEAFAEVFKANGLECAAQSRVD